MKLRILTSIKLWLPLTFIGITIANIIYPQPFIQVLPLYVSLVINALLSRANRYAPLIGACNCLLYGYAFYVLDLYGSMAYSVLVSCPLQLVTFFLWSKRPYRSSTMFRQLGKKRFLIMMGIFTFAWLVCYILLQAMGSSHIILDNTVSLLGILVSILTLLSFVEYTSICLLQTVLMLVLYGVMLPTTPSILVHFIFNVYTLVCVAKAYFHVRKLYTEQQQA